jgi:hypothetical protein
VWERRENGRHGERGTASQTDKLMSKQWKQAKAEEHKAEEHVKKAREVVYCT